MKKHRALAVVAAVLLILSATGLAGAVTTRDSLAADFDSSTTATDTVVVAVGDPGTDDGRASLVAANAIAGANNYTVVRVPSGELPPAVIQTLSKRVEHDDLRHAIVVGVDENDTDAVAAALTAVGVDVGGDEVTLDVTDQITGNSASDVLYKAAIQQWDTSDAAFLTTTAQTDTQKVSVALANDTLRGVPVLAQSSGYSDVNATLDYLDSSTVYVTPGVSNTMRSQLRDDGYTVVTAPGGVTLDQPLQDVAVGYTADTTEDVVVTDPSHVHAVSQIGVGANATVLVTASSTSLGNTTEAQLQNLTEVETSYVLGGTDDVSESVFSGISQAVRDNASVNRVAITHDETEAFLRTSLLSSGYTYGVLTTHVESVSDGDVTVDITNIGFSTVQVGDEASVTATWTGDGFESSTPNGSAQDGSWVVENPDPMDAGTTFTVTLEADQLDHGGHPELAYYVGDSGGLVGTSGGFGFFTTHVDTLADWVLDLVGPHLPDIDLGLSPLQSHLVTVGVAAAIILVATATVDVLFGGRLIMEKLR